MRLLPIVLLLAHCCRALPANYDYDSDKFDAGFDDPFFADDADDDVDKRAAVASPDGGDPYCPWGNCYNNGTAKTYQDLLDEEEEMDRRERERLEEEARRRKEEEARRRKEEEAVAPIPAQEENFGEVEKEDTVREDRGRAEVSR